MHFLFIFRIDQSKGKKIFQKIQEATWEVQKAIPLNLSYIGPESPKMASIYNKKKTFLKYEL